jgi:signal transduction histidine kinase/CheY-like chemotaxis protein/HPt (histidine-containing phosphotransfer) domain-containing protein
MRVKAAFVIMSIVFVITAAYFFLSLTFTRQNLVKTIEQDMSLITKITNDFITTKISLLHSDTATVAERLLKADSNEKMTEIMISQLEEFDDFISLTVYDRKGIIANCGEPASHDIFIAENKYIQAAFRGESIFSTTHYNNSSEAFTMRIFTPMGDESVLSATIQGMLFTNLLSDYRYRQTGNIFMNITGSSSDWHIVVSAPLNESPLVSLRNDLLFSALFFLAVGVLISIFVSGIVAQHFNKIEKQNQNLSELNKIAAAASEAKTSFLARMSHEMRTPLTAIIGLSDLTLETGQLNEENTENLDKIYNAGKTLLSTVNDILDISKIEAGKLELIPAEYETSSMLNDTITQNIMRIGDKPIKFILSINENLPTRLYGDDLRVKQIMNNLLSNAFKYTRGGTVELGVNCEREGNTIWMTTQVSDTGKGIRPEDVDKLFINYNQVDTKINHHIEGTGLGLSITKKMAEMMGGTIIVTSEYGKGSIFTAKFRQQYVTDTVIGAETVNSLKNFHYSDHKRRHSLHPARINLSYARVLVVDDVTVNLDVARGMMKPYKMHVDCVTGGQEAIDAVRAEKVRYNAIFMDHMMPEMDGIETTRIIREEIGSEYAKTVPIIALTANAIIGNEEMFLGKGFQAFLSKPIEHARLDTVIQKLVRNEELEKTLAADCGYDQRTFSRDITGLDMCKGLKRFNGDQDSYLDILRSYTINIPPLLDALGKVDKGNLADYAITVHGIKSSCRSIGAEALGNKAEALEKAAKEKDFSFVITNNAVFIDETEKLIDELNDMLRHMFPEKPRPKKDRPDSEALGRLLNACQALDIDKADAVMEDLTAWDYESDDGLVAWLSENVSQLNFTPIIEKLSTVHL